VSKLTLRAALAELAERPFSVLLFANLVQLAGGGIGYALMLYFFTYNLAWPDAFKKIGFVTLVARVAMIAAQPFSRDFYSLHADSILRPTPDATSWRDRSGR